MRRLNRPGAPTTKRRTGTNEARLTGTMVPPTGRHPKKGAGSRRLGSRSPGPEDRDAETDPNHLLRLEAKG